MTLTLYFLRHGQTADSRENVFCGSGRNPPLTPEGVEMAKEFAAAYRGLEWAAVYASPLTRALQTARALAEATKVAVAERDELKEIAYGEWEGCTVEEVDRTHHDEYVRWTADPAWNAPTGGEAAVAIARRVLRVIEEITQEYEHGNVLLVSHKATIRIALCSLLGVDVGRFRYRFACPVASVSVVEFGAQGPLLHRLADRMHLSPRLRALPGT